MRSPSTGTIYWRISGWACCKADSDELTIDETEMAEINFYTRDEVQAALAGEGPFVAPPPHAIAHYLMQWWIEK